MEYDERRIPVDEQKVSGTFRSCSLKDSKKSPSSENNFSMLCLQYSVTIILTDIEQEICTGILRDEIEAFLRHYLNNIRNGESPFREGIDIEIAEEAFVRFLYEYDNGLHNFSCNDEAG